MPKRRKEVTPVEELPPPEPEIISSEEPKKRKRGVFVPFDDFGGLDSARVRDPEALEQARIALAASSATSSAVVGEVQVVTEKHVRWFLDGYCTVASYGVPALINPRLRAGGAPEIPHELAASIYHLSEEQKQNLTPDGVEFFNQMYAKLPQWIKDILLSVGPGAKFFGQLAVITVMQTQTMMAQWESINTKQTVAPAPPAPAPAPVN